MRGPPSPRPWQNVVLHAHYYKNIEIFWIMCNPTDTISGTSTERQVSVRMATDRLFRWEAIRIEDVRFGIDPRIVMKGVDSDDELASRWNRVITWMQLLSEKCALNEGKCYQSEWVLLSIAGLQVRWDTFEAFLWCNTPNISVQPGPGAYTDDLNHQKRCAIPRRLVPGDTKTDFKVL